MHTSGLPTSLCSPRKLQTCSGASFEAKQSASAQLESRLGKADVPGSTSAAQILLASSYWLAACDHP